MKSFKEYLDEMAVRYGANRCTAVTCNAIAKHHGVKSAQVGPDHNLSTGAGLYQHLSKHFKVHGWGHEQAGKTVKQFVKDNPKGAHYIATNGHAMAVINGKLHDSSNKGANRRKVIASYKVTKKD